MPMYDFLCNKCGIEFEGFSSVKDKDTVKCTICEGDTRTLITQSGFQFYEGYDKDLDTYLTGPAQRRSIMKARGIEEVHKSELHRLDKNITKKKAPTVHDAFIKAREKGAFSLGEI